MIVDGRIQLTSIDVIASAMEPLVPSLERVSSPDGALTLMLSDIADADAVAERLGPERWERLLRDHRLLVEQTVTRHDGKVLHVERDGFLASFASAHAGLHTAVELQRTFASGGEPALGVRMGLHSGFILAGAGAPMGRNVVLTSRIAAHARAGEILVSSTLKQYTETDDRFRFEEHGEYHFKGMLGEHLVYRAHPR